MRYLGSALAIAFAFGGLVEARATEAPRPDAAIAFQWGVRIPLRDGVELAATLYRPEAQKAPLPCLFTLTPYIAQSYHDVGAYFAANGYVFLTVDVRGRGNSDGEFTPLLQEAKDGHDVVEWLAQQSYCNGKVAMYGASYVGYAQWATAKERPPHLATITPVVAVGPGLDFPMGNALFYTYVMRWLTLVEGRADQAEIFTDRTFWVPQFRRWYEAHAPFRQLDAWLGHSSPIFQTWVAHPLRDAYWDAFHPTPAQYAQMALPILSVTGHYDGNQAGALSFYRDHLRYGPPQGRDKHYLVIGPSDHFGTQEPYADVGGLHFGPAALIDMKALHKAWYDWTLKGGARPEFLKDKVAFYVTVEEAWRYAPSLQAATAGTRTWYLDSDGRADDVFHAGRLRADKPGAGKPDRYVYDPLDTSPLDYESSSDRFDPGYAPYVDQRRVVLSSGKQLVYHTPPLEQDTDVAGFFALSAFLSLDQPDTDFIATLYQIKPDGGSVLLSKDQMRARHRESLREQKPVPPGQVLRYDFERFGFIARRLLKGSRLRLVLAPVNSIGYQKNYNTGGVVAEESGKDARPVTVTLYHDEAHPSALRMPLASASSVPAK